MSEIFATPFPDMTQRERDHDEISRELAGECIVLLENKGALPLKDTSALALFGAGARSTIKGGTGSGSVNTRSLVNVEQGLEQAGFHIATKEWLDKQEQHSREDKEAFLKKAQKEAGRLGVPVFLIMFDHPYSLPAPAEITEEELKKAAEKTDTALYVISRLSGEGADRYNKKGDYLPFDEEVEQVQALTHHFSKVILILNIGGIMDLKAFKNMEGLSAILLMSQLGHKGGEAVGDILSGKISPSAKTTETWAENYMDYPSSAKFSHNESVHEEMYEDGIYVGYRYFDSFDAPKPVYPFGFGLSYTTFEIKTLNAGIDKDRISLEVQVTNTGEEYSGKEVVQVYASAAFGRLDHPYQELVAFQKTKELAPQESQILTISFPVSSLASFDEEDASWKLDAKEYILRIGNSSDNTVPAAIVETGEAEIAVAIGKNICALDTDLSEIVPIPGQVEEKVLQNLPEGLPRLVLEPQNIVCQVFEYQKERPVLENKHENTITLEDVRNGKHTLEELVAQLSVEEMAEMCVGTLRNDNSSVVGNASYIVPGAAGDTSSILKETRDVKNLILADGPAGLRLQPVFKTSLDGELLPGGSVMDDDVEPFPEEYNETNSVNYYQYCTSIPIGWALAHSWNTDLVQKAGDMVGSEMEEFNVDLWLAPALNIQRNPLCGRNFEYYSEDPLISGKMAAAMTLGVQSHPGKGTTIKHFAANNQEDNRYFVNAHIGERALREIYLKGFETAVRESQPLSIMTSYNLLNGIHTANSYDLLQSAARDEWGFEGFVMTDWFTSQSQPAITGKYGESQYPISSSVGCIAAGNDVQMPGCQLNVDDIVEAVATGKPIDGYTITKGDLQFNTLNILRTILKIQEQVNESSSGQRQPQA